MSEVAEMLALLDKHTPAPAAAKVGLSPERVRALLGQPESGLPKALSPKRVRTLMRAVKVETKRERPRATTPRGKRYGWLQIAVKNIPAEGILVPTLRAAENYAAVGRRLGIKLQVVRVRGGGGVRHVLPALTPAEVSRDCAML